MARKKDQARRRDLLKQAAARAIAGRGLAGVRVKDVAEEAGMSPASVLYYYPDLEELLVETIHATLERFAGRRGEVAEAIPDPRAQLVETIRAGFPAGPRDDELVVLYQSVSFFRDNPLLRSLIRSLTEQQVELYRRILEVGQAKGVFDLADDSRTIARNLVALEDAYGLYIVSGQPVLDEAMRQVLSYASLATRRDLHHD